MPRILSALFFFPVLAEASFYVLLAESKLVKTLLLGVSSVLQLGLKVIYMSLILAAAPFTKLRVICSVSPVLHLSVCMFPHALKNTSRCFCSSAALETHTWYFLHQEPHTVHHRCFPGSRAEPDPLVSRLFTFMLKNKTG